MDWMKVVTAGVLEVCSRPLTAPSWTSCLTSWVIVFTIFTIYAAAAPLPGRIFTSPWVLGVGKGGATQDDMHAWAWEHCPHVHRNGSAAAAHCLLLLTPSILCHCARELGLKKHQSALTQLLMWSFYAGVWQRTSERTEAGCKITTSLPQMASQKAFPGN